MVLKWLHCNVIEKALNGYRYFQKMKVMGNINAVILMEFSSMSAQRVAILTTFRVSVRPVKGISSNYGCIHSTKIEGGSKTQFVWLTHWGRVPHICISKLSIISSDNGLSPSQRHTIIWTNAGILLIGHLGANFGEILIPFCIFWFKKLHLKTPSGKWWPFCLGLNVLTFECYSYAHTYTGMDE